MIKLTIDKIPVEVKEGTTILDAAKSVGIFLPTLCHLPGINDIGACRICVAEIEGCAKLVTTCNTPVLEGMNVLTNSSRARRARMTNMQLTLSQHNCDCPTCIKSTDCELQQTASALGVITMPFEKRHATRKWDMTQPLIRDGAKCIKCMRCIQVCRNVQELGVWGLDGAGARTAVTVARVRDFAGSGCALCMQCINHCPTGALSVRDDTARVWGAINDPDVITVVRVPAPLTDKWHGGGYGGGRLVSALRGLGFDYVFDIGFSNDLAIMDESGKFIRMFMDRRQGTIKEEGDEFIRTYTAGRQSGFPLFTSDCAGVVRFIKEHYPEMISHLSTTKSPQQMFGLVMKTHLAEKLGVDPSRIFAVSIMPCAAKKAESELPGMDSTGAGPDIDLVLTMDELQRMITAGHIKPEGLRAGQFDTLPEIPGSGVTLGASGGMMEASLRTVHYQMTGKFADRGAFTQIHERGGWREAFFDIAGTRVKVAVATGLKNVRALIEATKKGEVDYDYVELMACPDGCAGGSRRGSMRRSGDSAREQSDMYSVGNKSVLVFSSENPVGSAVYETLQNSDIVQKIHGKLSTDHSV